MNRKQYFFLKINLHNIYQTISQNEETSHTQCERQYINWDHLRMVQSFKGGVPSSEKNMMSEKKKSLAQNPFYLV